MGKIHREFDYQQRPATKEWNKNHGEIKWDMDIKWDGDSKKFVGVERKTLDRKEKKHD